jgi:hypothetical protein
MGHRTPVREFASVTSIKAVRSSQCWIAVRHSHGDSIFWPLQNTNRLAVVPASALKAKKKRVSAWYVKDHIDPI